MGTCSKNILQGDVFNPLLFIPIPPGLKIKTIFYTMQIPLHLMVHTFITSIIDCLCFLSYFVIHKSEEKLYEERFYDAWSGKNEYSISDQCSLRS